MTFAETLEQMSSEDIKANFEAMMSEIVTQHGDDKSEQSTESEQTSK